MKNSEKIEARISDAVKSTELMRKVDLSCENELMLSKWPAYRFQSPIHSTKLFSIAYRQALQGHIRTNFNMEKAENILIYNQVIFDKTNQLASQLWTARQTADLIGAPYDLILRHCFEFAARRSRRHPPQPNQLFGGDNSREVWFAAFKKFFCAERRQIELSRMEPMPQYRTGYSPSTPARDIFLRDLVNTARESNQPCDIFIGRNVLVLGYLSEDEYKLLVDDPLYESNFTQAKCSYDLGLFEKATFREMDHADALPSCFALPGVDVNKDTCEECPFLSACEDCRAKAVDRLKLISKSGDPRVDKVRAQTAARQKKFRDAKRKTAAASSP